MERPSDEKFEQLTNLTRYPSILFDGRVFVGQNHGVAYMDVLDYVNNVLRAPGGRYEGLTEVEVGRRVHAELQEGYGNTPETFRLRNEVQIPYEGN